MILTAFFVLLALASGFTFYTRRTSKGYRSDISNFERGINHMNAAIAALKSDPDNPIVLLDEGKIIARLDEVNATRDDLLNERDDLLHHLENKAQENPVTADN